MTHAVVWIDHKEARIFHVHPEATDETTVLAPQHHVHRHPKGRGEAREHPDDAHRFFGEVARRLDASMPSTINRHQPNTRCCCESLQHCKLPRDQRSGMAPTTT